MDATHTPTPTSEPATRDFPRAATGPVAQPRLLTSAVNTLATLRPAWIEARIANAMHRNVPKQLAATRAAGAQFAWSVGNRPLCQCVFGNAAAQSPMTERTPFRVASLGKPMVAYAALQLAQRGLLDLDAPVGPMLHDLPASLRLDRVTPRHLLSHTAGLADRSAPHLPLTQAATIAEILSGTHGRHFMPTNEYEPGTLTKYTGSGYMLLQVLLERATGLPFPALMDELVTQPLALDDTGFDPLSPRTLGIEHDAHGSPLAPTWTPSVASSGLWTTATDMVRFGRDVLASAASPGGPLATNFARQLLTPQPAGLAGADFALGFHVQHTAPTRCLSHGGVRPGLRSLFLVFPNASMVFAGIVNGAGGTAIIRPLRGLLTDLAARRAGRPPSARP